MVNNVYERSFFLQNAYDTKCMQSKIQGCLYIILHMPCQMQEMHKEKLYICYKRSSHTPTQEIKHTPSSLCKRVKVVWSRGLVKILASWSCVGTWIKAIFPFSTLSLRKWYLTFMCLVLEWSTGFFATLMALVLSHWSGTWVYSSAKSLMVYVIQRSWEQQLAATTYSASLVDWATFDCLREDQDTKEVPKNWQIPEVDFLSNRHPAKSASEKPWWAKEEDAEYQRSKSGVWCKYLKIRFTACQCEVLEDTWKRAHRHTENWMSGLVAVR
jgi:hypothetical protein